MKKKTTHFLSYTSAEASKKLEYSFLIKYVLMHTLTFVAYTSYMYKVMLCHFFRILIYALS